MPPPVSARSQLGSVCFICASFEPGRDGVGDHVRRLALKLARSSARVSVLALADKYVNAERSTTGEINVLRVPVTSPPEAAAQAIDRFLGSQAPDLLSFHFVPWPYGWKGILLNPARLSWILGRYALHIMIHELWVWDTGARAGVARRIRQRLLGLVQKLSIKRFLRQVRPVAVTTTNPRYAEMLAGIGIRGEIMPLFGNIEPAPGARDSYSAIVTRAIRAAFCPDDWRVVVIFGEPREQFDPGAIFLRQSALALAEGRRLMCLSVGRLGGRGGAMMELWPQLYPDVRFAVAGELLEEEISTILHHADFGLNHHPEAVIGRSGTIAAMLEHGLPVLFASGVTAEDLGLRGGEASLIESVRYMTRLIAGLRDSGALPEGR